MNKKINSKKVISFIVSILALTGFIILIACNSSHSKVFKLQKGEAESLGVVFPEEGSPYESYISLFDKFMKDKEYEKAVVVAKKMIEVFPKESGEHYEGYPYTKKDGYFALRSSYIELGRYNEAIEVDKKIWELAGTSIDFRDVFFRIILLDKANKQKEAVKILKKYRKILPEGDISNVDGLIKRAEQAVANEKKIFPESETIK